MPSFIIFLIPIRFYPDDLKHHNLVFCLYVTSTFFSCYGINTAVWTKKLEGFSFTRWWKIVRWKPRTLPSYTKTSLQKFIQTRGYLVDFLILAGMWRVSLEPVEAGGPYNVTAASNKETVTLTDVLFGDVWLCGGQSNMEFPTSRVCQRGFFCYYKQVQSEKSGLYNFIFVKKKKSSLLDF